MISELVAAAMLCQRSTLCGPIGFSSMLRSHKLTGTAQIAQAKTEQLRFMSSAVSLEGPELLCLLCCGTSDPSPDTYDLKSASPHFNVRCLELPRTVIAIRPAANRERQLKSQDPQESECPPQTCRRAKIMRMLSSLIPVYLYLLYTENK